MDDYEFISKDELDVCEEKGNGETSSAASTTSAFVGHLHTMPGDLGFGEHAADEEAEGEVSSPRVDRETCDSAQEQVGLLFSESQRQLLHRRIAATILQCDY